MGAIGKPEARTMYAIRLNRRVDGKPTLVSSANRPIKVTYSSCCWLHQRTGWGGAPSGRPCIRPDQKKKKRIRPRVHYPLDGCAPDPGSVSSRPHCQKESHAFQADRTPSAIRDNFAPQPDFIGLGRETAPDSNVRRGVLRAGRKPWARGRLPGFLTPSTSVHDRGV